MSDMTDPSSEQLGTLISGIGALTTEVGALKDQATADAAQKALDEQAAEKREKAKDKRVRRTFLIVIAIGVIGVIFGVLGTVNAQSATDHAKKAQTALDVFLAQRSSSRRVACFATNDTNDHINRVVDGEIQTFDLIIAASQNSTISTPEDKQRSLDFFTSLKEQRMADKVVLSGPGTINGRRDCSDQGNAAYYQDADATNGS